MNHGVSLQSMAILNFERLIPNDYQVKISHDFKQVVFVCPHFENTLLEILDDGTFSQTRSVMMSKVQARFIFRDTKKGGFNILGYDDYD